VGQLDERNSSTRHVGASKEHAKNEQSRIPRPDRSHVHHLLPLGFAYGFINVLNAQFRQAARYDVRTSFDLHAAYFGAYVVGPILIARQTLKRWGFKATLISGLSIYSCGMLVFWPARRSGLPASICDLQFSSLGWASPSWKRPWTCS